MRRRWPIAAWAAALFAGSVAALATSEVGGPSDERPGGATTVWATGQNAFSFPAANLPDDERTRFAIGNSFFKRNWVEAPASTQARDGLGPHFIARSCGGCHALDGRGAPPDFSRGLAAQPVALLMRLSVPGSGPHGGPNPEPVYGDQLNNAAVQGVKTEGEVTLRRTPVHGRFADGTRYTLQRPHYGFARLGYGPMDPQVMLFDEVTSALDPELVGGILQILRDLSARRSMTMIIVTHQMKFAERSSDRTLFFDQGNIVEDAESSVLFSQPKEARTRQFLDSVIEGQ